MTGNSQHSTTKPKVSVVLSVYKNIDDLKYTLQSILSQTGISFEIILIDDHNTIDDHNKLIRITSGHCNVKLIRNEENLGLTASLIKGCIEAKGDYIARLDNSDLMIPADRLQSQSEILDKSPNIGLTSGQIEIVDMVSNSVYRSRHAKSEINFTDLHQNPKIQISHVTVMFRREAYFKAGGYSKSHKTGQDTELWTRLLEISDGHIENRVLAIATMNQNSISVKRNNSQILIKINRLLKDCYQSTWNYRNLKTLLINIPFEFTKFLIPKSLRMRLKYSTNMDYVGKISDSKRLTMKDTYEYYLTKPSNRTIDMNGNR